MTSFPNALESFTETFENLKDREPEEVYTKLIKAKIINAIAEGKYQTEQDLSVNTVVLDRMKLFLASKGYGLDISIMSNTSDVDIVYKMKISWLNG